MDFKLDKGNGYMYCYSPDHYCANGSGKVYEHVYVISELIGRKLNVGECVHHIDRVKTNNHQSNLRLMSLVEHTKLHQMEDKGVVWLEIKCPVCSSLFMTTDSLRKYCSHTCSRKAKEKFSITKEDLEFLVWSQPTTHIAMTLGVSDTAVAKRCAKLGVSKPPRGYWAKPKIYL